MKKVLMSLFALSLLGIYSIKADQVSESLISSQLGQSVNDQISEDSDLITYMSEKNIDSVLKKAQTFTTSTYFYQYTIDGSALQHVGVYPNSVICTNVSGPREGVQFVIANTGALMDMCHTYTKHKNYFTNKYPWGEVNTYENKQIVKVK